MIEVVWDLNLVIFWILIFNGLEQTNVVEVFHFFNIYLSSELFINDDGNRCYCRWYFDTNQVKNKTIEIDILCYVAVKSTLGIKKMSDVIRVPWTEK